MKNLDWSQAYALGVTGIAVRREPWTKWLVLRGTLWWIGTSIPQELHVVVAPDFGAEEFLAKDWTDEPWDDASGGAISQPPAGSTPPTAPGATPPRTGPGWGGGSNPSGPTSVNPPAPAPTGPPAAPPGDPGGGDGGGGGGGGGGSGGGGGTREIAAPTVTVSFFTSPSEFLPPPEDGTPFGKPEGCYLYGDTPINTGALTVLVTISGGPSGLGTIDVTVGDQHRLGTAYRGFSGGFSFDGIVVLPGGGLTANATYRIGGKTYTGSGVLLIPGQCD